MKLELTNESINLIVNKLLQSPMNEVEATINSIREQVNANVESDNNKLIAEKVSKARLKEMQEAKQELRPAT